MEVTGSGSALRAHADARSLIAFLRRTVLRRPTLNVKALPHAPGRKFVQRLGEPFSPAYLICSLLRHAQKGSDLGHAHESHSSTLYPLTTSSASAYTALDNVKEEEMTVQDATDLLTWIIEQSEGDKGQLAYEAELATEDATDDLAKALTA